MKACVIPSEPSSCRGFGMDGHYDKAIRVNCGPFFAKVGSQHMYAVYLAAAAKKIYFGEHV